MAARRDAWDAIFSACLRHVNVWDETPSKMRKTTRRASVGRCASRSCSRWACCCWRSPSTRRSRCWPSDRARQGVVANEAYLELQGSVDAAWKSLNDFAPALGRGTTARLDPNLPLALRMGRKHLDDALGVIDRYLEKEPRSSRRSDFENRRLQIASLGDAAGRRGERAGDGRCRRRSEGAAGVREPLRDADAQPEPDAAAAARRERPDRAAPVRRRGDGAVDRARAGRGGAGGGGRGVPVHAAIAAAAVGAARARAAAGRAATTRSGRASRRATRSAIWRASSTRWPTRSRSASSA